ncbi:RNA ligase-domain-containing protein [Dimargaris cristalligena]|uniref:tRNA ligase n=1 Tax=Dimargaris cristalligena TaxID=215637 RepID=A0A4P9ZW18_9FUNG|nr:RNA ligase-domain-containing protein [Dimargaris cristalligena]|eukprot:RKP37052.1 RNA ligase-domain-containing protein [Dimargaris cristalligena]
MLTERHPEVQALWSQTPSVPLEADRKAADQIVKELTAIVSEGRAKKLNRGIRRTEYSVPETSVPISSWHFTEYMYKRDPCPFPTLARGLFTRPSPDPAFTYDIVARGYDKFFNTGEVPKTKDDWLAAETEGPYELTVKENGCLILVAALDASTLLVTSKHAVGPGKDAQYSHSQVGRRWVTRHLQEIGRTEAELAEFLWGHRSTAVFELCDDEFEEHILEYTDRRRGLYLHGINRNTRDLHTWPSELVTRVADVFGFHRTGYFTESTHTDVKAFADEIRQAQALDGRAVEGFVVRCREKATGQDFMYKIKYDEPYLMYREWREITKRIISRKPFRTQYPLSRAYAQWIRGYLSQDPTRGPGFLRNQGIIAARNAFLTHLKSSGHSLDIDVHPDAPRKTVLIPIATIGCGKTTLATALTHLYPSCGHVQNDNITVKRGGPEAFHQAILNELVHHDVVIADRNNHLAQHREALTREVSSVYPNCRFVALYWNVDQVDGEKVFKATSQRIRQRGENHQSLTPGRTQNFETVMWSFLKGFHPFDNDSGADHLITQAVILDPFAETRTNLGVTVDFLIDKMDFPAVTPKELDHAMEVAFGYHPTVRKEVKGKPMKQAASYFGIKIEEDLGPRLEQALREKRSQSPTAVDTCLEKLADLKKTERLPGQHHLTLIHSLDMKGSPANRELFEAYEKLWAQPSHSITSISVDYVVWNEDLMVCHVSHLQGPNVDSYVVPGHRGLHVTVGTASSSVKPFLASSALVKLKQTHGSLDRYLEQQTSAAPTQSEPVGGGEFKIVRLDPPLNLTGYLFKYL